jgi:putative FmdB family regulatory protein
MPIYEFVCQACGHEFEQIVPFSATTSPRCTVCQSEQVQRQLSRPAIHFKGSGWYITDSKASKTSANGNDGEKTGAAESTADSKEGAPSTKAESKSEAKSESKSEAKSETKSETKAATTTD